ncbi:MAG: hypothetical protein ACI4VQ_06275 [Clostridia bacterium]
MKIILIIILCWAFYIIGEENGKEKTTRLIKQYLEESENINDFLYRFTIMWNRNVGDKK